MILRTKSCINMYIFYNNCNCGSRKIILNWVVGKKCSFAREMVWWSTRFDDFALLTLFFYTRTAFCFCFFNKTVHSAHTHLHIRPWWWWRRLFYFFHTREMAFLHNFVVEKALLDYRVLIWRYGGGGGGCGGDAMIIWW